jgi:hypothetical protein
MLMVAVQNAAIARPVSLPIADPAAIANWRSTRFAMKYIVPTAKHHDCYHPTCDWWHPEFPLTSPGGSVKRERSGLDACNQYLLSQICELVATHGPLITIWDDVPQCSEGRPAADLSARKFPLNIRAEASNVYHQMTADYGPQFAFDGNDKTRWATDDGTSQAWISADLGSARSIHGVRIHEAYAGRVQNYELQHRDGTAWKTFLTGATLGADFEATFPAIKAREFRLNILSARQAPTIQEIEWF